jgi:hypothetical protein
MQPLLFGYADNTTPRDLPTAALLLTNDARSHQAYSSPGHFWLFRLFRLVAVVVPSDFLRRHMTGAWFGFGHPFLTAVFAALILLAFQIIFLGHRCSPRCLEVGESKRLSENFVPVLGIAGGIGRATGGGAAQICDRQTELRPFLFATGYGSDGLPAKYRDRPSLQKPFQFEALATVLSAMKRDPIGL